MAYLTEPLKMEIPCDCGRWRFRDIPMAGGIAPFAVQQHCPRCKTRRLLVFRVAVGDAVYVRYLGQGELAGPNEVDLVTALRGIPGLTRDETSLMVQVARLISAAAAAA